METGFKSLGQREMAGRGMVTPFCIHGLGCSFFPGRESHTRIHLQSKASTAGAGQGPLQGWVLLPKCTLLGPVWGRESVCLGMTGQYKGL